MSETRRVDVAIVGGGITGLALAHFLSAAGKSFVVLEPGTPGGFLTTVTKEGFTLENGPNVFVEKPAMRRLLESTGLQEYVCSPAIARYDQLIWNGKAPIPAPRGLLPFFRSPLLTLWEKLSIVKKTFRGGVLTPRSEDESVAIFMERVLGERLVASLLDPALKGIYGGRVDRLSARSLFPGMWAAACEGKSMFAYLRRKPPRGKIFVLRDGAASLPRALVEHLPADSLSAVTATSLVRHTDGDWTVSCSDGSVVSSRSVVFTTSGTSSARVLRASMPALAADLENVRYASLSVIHCAVADTDLRFDRAFGVVFPEGSAHRTLGIMFNSKLFPHSAPKGQQLLTVCLGGSDSNNDPIHTNAAQAACKAIEEFLGISRVTVLNTCFWERAIPQLSVGHHLLVEHIQQVESKNSGFYYGGTDIGGIGVPDRIEVAEKICRRIAGDQDVRV